MAWCLLILGTVTALSIPLLDGSIITTWSTGCLSDLHPAYAPFNSYNHGFANVELTGSDFAVTNHRIHKGRLLN